MQHLEGDYRVDGHDPHCSWKTHLQSHANANANILLLLAGSWTCSGGTDVFDADGGDGYTRAGALKKNLGAPLQASGSLAMTTLRQSWLRGPRCQQGWGVTQKTQAMMLNRMAMGSLVATHKKGAMVCRGLWVGTYSTVRSTTMDRCRRWGKGTAEGGGSDLFIDGRM